MTGDNGAVGRDRFAGVRRPVATGLATLVPDPDRADAWLLLVDGTQQSHVNLADPTSLGFEYVRRIAHVIDLLPAGPLRVVHLGGGAMTLARFCSATRPGTHNVVVEVDEALVQLVREHLPWPREFVIRVRTAEARSSLDQLPPGSADLLISDVFVGGRTPGPFTTVEAFTRAAEVLCPGGTFVANIADEAPLTYARRFVAGVAEAFSDVTVVAEPGVLRARRFGNLVVIGRHRDAEPLDVALLTRRCSGDAWPARVLHGPGLDDFLGGHRPFQDASAPGSPTPPEGVFG